MAIKITDINGVEFEVEKEDFKLVQNDKKIYDKKFESKPTTFLKDALKRFSKNKSSVVAAIIIGILALFAIFVPIFNTHDVSSPRTYERFLSPKLFDFNGNGSTFWAGTTHYDDKIWDPVNEKVIGDFKEDCVGNLKLSADGEKFIDLPSTYGHGGTLIISYTTEISDTEDPKNKSFSLFNSNYVSKITANDGMIISYDLNDSYGNYSNLVLTDQYRIILSYTDGDEVKKLVLKDYTNDFADVTVNVSEVLASNSLTEVSHVRFYFEILPSSKGRGYMGFDGISLSATNSTLNEEVSKMSWNDANAQALLSNVNPAHWNSTGRITDRGVHNVHVTMASFDYDEYKAVFGLQEHSISNQEMETYIRNGWCEYDGINPSSFKKLSDKCPVEEVISQKNIDTAYELTCNVTMYRYYGYDSMPKFLFGTDQLGRDIFKYAFFALQTSFLIAIVVTAINFTIGLVYGAIEGYFGGNVDLIMERITDILAYIPFTVMITLIFLNLGRTLLVFALGMCMTGWIGVAGRTRTQFYRFKGREYVLASRTLGASDFRLIFKHILPNALGTLVTTSILMVPTTVVSESALSYLGLGLQGTASFGVVLSDNQQYLSSHPALILFPAVIISLLMISFNLFGNGLRDALNPSLKGSD